MGEPEYGTKKKNVGTINTTSAGTRDLRGTISHVTGAETIRGTPVDHARPDLRAKKEPPK